MSMSRQACAGPARRWAARVALGPGILALAACASVPAQQVATVPVPEPAGPPAAMQWLYGSGEGAAASIQTYHAFRDFVVAAAKARPVDSVILAEGATLAKPAYVPCGNKPLAVLLDVDETAIQNLGYEYGEAANGWTYDAARWDRWEKTGADKVAPMPGAVTALRAVRQAGVTVVFNSNRMAGNAAGTEAAILAAGLGPAKHGETLFLKGDDATGSAKDGRRAHVATRYCVIAMAGDQFGDFTDLLNNRSLSVPERRRVASSGWIADKWGNGWFLFSNPVYGPSIRGNFDDVFPADKRWSDPAGEN